MKCPKCQTENLADSAFCEECSAPLEVACPSCGTANRPSAELCRKCRADLNGARAVVSRLLVGKVIFVPEPEERAYVVRATLAPARVISSSVPDRI